MLNVASVGVSPVLSKLLAITCVKCTMEESFPLDAVTVLMLRGTCEVIVVMNEKGLLQAF